MLDPADTAEVLEALRDKGIEATNIRRRGHICGCCSQDNRSQERRVPGKDGRKLGRHYLLSCYSLLQVLQTVNGEYLSHLSVVEGIVRLVQQVS